MMSVTITISPWDVLALVYLIVALMLLSAGLIDRSSFTDPRYHEVFIIVVIWPIWALQWPYYWVTGRILYEDIKSLLGRSENRLFN